MSTAEPLFASSVRPMLEADLDRVVTVERACFTTPWSGTTFTNLLVRRDADLWVATVDGIVTGHAVTWYAADEAELGNLAVMPGWRGRGIGRQLLEYAIGAARARGGRRLFLEVRESNAAAQRLYRSLAFETVGMRRRYYRSPIEDARVMCLALSGPA